MVHDKEIELWQPDQTLSPHQSRANYHESGSPSSARDNSRLALTRLLAEVLGSIVPGGFF